MVGRGTLIPALLSRGFLRAKRRKASASAKTVFWGALSTVPCRTVCPFSFRQAVRAHVVVEPGDILVVPAYWYAIPFPSAGVVPPYAARGLGCTAHGLAPPRSVAAEIRVQFPDA